MLMLIFTTNTKYSSHSPHKSCTNNAMLMQCLKENRSMPSDYF